MVEDILDPLEEYQKVFAPRFSEVCNRTFDELAAEAKVDVEANREVCRKIRSTEEHLASVSKKLKMWKVACGVMWAGVVIAAVVLAVKWSDLPWWGIALCFIGIAGLLAALFVKVHPFIKQYKKESSDAHAAIDQLKAEAWKQMEPLNNLFDWDVFARMAAQTVPRLEFDPFFTTQRLADLEMVYGWDGSFNKDRSVIFSHSGLINGNPFVFCRSRRMQWGNRTYHGEMTIHWTTYEQDSNGKTVAREHSETLRADYTAPYPNYFEKTNLIYGNTAAPDLTFTRKKSGLAGKDGSLRFKWNRRQLRKKSEDLKNADYAMMTNEEFEVAFDTRDRNNNQQFALLFTPLAQENIMALLTDDQIGYGDDFNFIKNRMINVVTADHMQNLQLDMNPDQYRNYDYDKAADFFRTTNAEYFRAIYFNLAPLLCVPMYQQIRPLHEIYGREMPLKSSFWEHESLANCWGQSCFRHPECVTDCILKTEEEEHSDGTSTLHVSAYGHRSEERVAYVSVRGGDGCMHDVPVEWYEYFPVVGVGSILMKEDNTTESNAISAADHGKHVVEVLQDNGLDFYRRHIASKLLN